MKIKDMERQEWFYHPVTQNLLEHLKESRQATMEAWASQAYTEKGSNEAALGHVQALQTVIDHLEQHNIEELSLDQMIGGANAH